MKKIVFMILACGVIAGGFSSKSFAMGKKHEPKNAELWVTDKEQNKDLYEKEVKKRQDELKKIRTAAKTPAPSTSAPKLALPVPPPVTVPKQAPPPTVAPTVPPVTVPKQASPSVVVPTPPSSVPSVPPVSANASVPTPPASAPVPDRD